jgi:hypothetical protein
MLRKNAEEATSFSERAAQLERQLDKAREEKSEI